MLILFGSKNKGRRLRPLLDTYCYECAREVTWDWYCVTEWFTAYFIPVLPVRKEYVLVCSTCADQLSIERRTARAVENLGQLGQQESQALHDELVSRLEEHQLREKTAMQREYLRTRRRTKSP